MSTPDATVFQRAVNTVRMLSAEGVEKAKSGHPGLPMGCADFGFTLWSRRMRFNPANPQWLGRDRFVLSGGHGKWGKDDSGPKNAPEFSGDVPPSELNAF